MGEIKATFFIFLILKCTLLCLHAKLSVHIFIFKAISQFIYIYRFAIGNFMAW